MSRDYGDWLGLRNQVCVVTGAAGGIGYSVAEAFLAAGARVMIVDVQEEACRSAASRLASGGGDVVGVACDVADPRSVAAAAQDVAVRLGACDILVNNAGVLRPGGYADLGFQDWQRVIDVNLTGAFICAQTFGRPMLDRGSGSIVHLASIAGGMPQSFSGAYSVSKAGVAMLSAGLATEWGPYGVRSNCVSPAQARTPMSEPFLTQPGMLEARSAFVPVRRVASASEVADAVLFLASKRAAFINGANLHVDGGLRHVLLDQLPRPGFQR